MFKFMLMFCCCVLLGSNVTTCSAQEQKQILMVNGGSTQVAGGTLTVKANGTTSSAGWKKVQLKARSYTKPPVDGLIEIDFVGVEPKVSAQVLTPVNATLRLQDLKKKYPWAKGVRILANANSLEIKF